MTTKYPLLGNQVTTRRARGERGVALISVIAILVLLAMVATPFLLTMRDSAARGERFLVGARADDEARALFETVRSHLIAGIEDVERRKLDETDPALLSGGNEPPPDATPTYDIPAELALPASVLERFNRSTAKEHRIWAAEIVDTQGLVNLNNCSYPILSNLLGRTEVAAATTSDTTTIPLTRIPDTFPAADGVVRIGSECVKYKAIVGNDLVNCERGYKATVAGNGPPTDIDLGAPVMLESCWQIATRPFRLRPGAWVRYTTVDQARTVSDMDVAALLPQDFERMRPYVTAWNGNAVGDGWCNPQTVRNAVSAGNRGETYARLKNVRYFGPGTMVRITDGVNEDYGVITRVRGADEVAIAGEIRHDYQADQARMYCLARSPINVNTADVSTLALVFNGLKLRGKTNSITDRQAEDLAVALKQWVRPVPAGAPTPTTPPAPGVFRDWDDFTNAVESAQKAGTIDQDGVQAVLLNALNANDSRLAFSTVPFVFRSYDTYEVRATVSIQGAEGREMARRELRRVMEVSSTRSGTFVVESQDDFQNQIAKSRDAKYMATYPVNVNAAYDGRNIPASEYQAYANQSLFPSSSREPAIGDVQLLPAAFRMTAGNRKDNVEHFDEEKTPDGRELKEDSWSLSVDFPYDPPKGTLDLVDVLSIDGHKNEIELGMKEFACSFWYRPEWDRDKSEHVIFDYGLDNDHMDRVSLRYDPERNALVLAVADATREQRSAEIVYRFENTTWEPKTWYHIACHVHGAGPGMMQLFIDGEQVGQSSVLTRLTQSIAAIGQGAGTSISVEDARDFPDSGVLLLRGPEGIELMEYSSRTGDTFAISRRKARSIDYTPTDTTQRSHAEGDTVELYGYSAPLLCDLTKGGSNLDGTIGPWRAYRFAYTGDRVTYAYDDTTRTYAGLANPGQGGTASTVTGVTLQDWDTGSTDVAGDIGQAGAEGIAMIVSALYATGANSATVMPDSQGAPDGTAQSPAEMGGIEFVRYVVGTTPGTVDITARNLTLRHVSVTEPSSGPRFMPAYGFGDAAVEGSDRIENDVLGIADVNGAMTAFIPIALVGSASGGAEYLDPQDEEPQLRYATRSINNQTVDMARAYVQVDGEWVCYDTFDQNESGQLLSGGKLAFLRETTLGDVAGMAGSGTSGTPAFPWACAGLLNWSFTEPQPSTRAPGGSGGNSTNDAPPVATDENTEEATPMTESVATGSLPSPPVQSWEIAQTLDFRGFEKRNAQLQYRIANTVPIGGVHNATAPILPCVAVRTGNNLEIRNSNNAGAAFAYPGFNDLVTMRDTDGDDEQLRVQWGYRGWFAPTSPPTQTWGWDRPRGADGNSALSRWDSRAWTRAIKFPSGEMPDGGVTKGAEKIRFGKKYDDTGSVAQATIDEVAFWQFKRAPKERPDYAFLGAVPPEVAEPQLQQQLPPGQAAPPTRFTGIDDKTEEFVVHLPIRDDSGQVLYPYGLPIHGDTFASDGGVIQIDDELILYDEFDLAQGKFSGCARGAFNTQPISHQYGARIVPVFAFPASRLTAPIDEATAEYQLQDTSDFPDDGYLRVGLGGEIIGYTEWAAGQLSAPLGRFEQSDDNTPRKPGEDDKRSAGSIFRGRFGTVPEAANAGQVAIAMPFRVYDRYAERADDPEQSYLQLSWTKHESIWKRVSWDLEPRANIDVVGLLRFSGGPAWDSDRIVELPANAVPTDDDRRKYLYMYTDPKSVQLLNVEADRIEVRLGVRYAKNAYDRFAEIAPDTWKETPAIRKVTVEYVCPPQVLTQE